MTKFILVETEYGPGVLANWNGQVANSDGSRAYEWAGFNPGWSNEYGEEPRIWVTDEVHLFNSRREAYNVSRRIRRHMERVGEICSGERVFSIVEVVVEPQPVTYRSVHTVPFAERYIY